MSWCPKCKTEYREGYDICGECGSILVDKLGIEEQMKNELEMSLLITVRDDIQAQIVESLLNSYNIPVIMKHNEAGNYLNVYMGTSFLGIDIYVPESALEEANGILRTEFNENIDDEIVVDKKDEEALNIAYDKHEKKRRVRAWGVLVFFYSGIIITLVVALWFIIKMIFDI